jgi:Rieske Fe-S protein
MDGDNERMDKLLGRASIVTLVLTPPEGPLMSKPRQSMIIPGYRQHQDEQTANEDNYFRHADSDHYAWQSEEVEPGDRIHLDDFEDYESWENDIGRGGLGKPALATWRSQDVPPSFTMPVQIIRSPLIEEAEADPWLETSTQRGFIAFLDKCTHFCCVPGFKSFQDSEKFQGEGNHVYCQCHQSVYDPFSLVRRSFVALPRPEE